MIIIYFDNDTKVGIAEFHRAIGDKGKTYNGGIGGS
jgi:hypothetical protein